ncbi:MAG TPA: YvcK family protein [Candidatus Dojkabacteria bacterium]|nr:YvcK family protein [Candidatus Dojkabacteria bacterium]
MKITVIGGGTGSTTVLEGLKKKKDLDLNVIVGMMDDGGSNAVVRDEFGLLPLSDLRKSIIALSQENENQMLRNLFTYRFSQGNGLKGHTLGNLLMIAMTEITGSEVEAIEMFKYFFSVTGNIIPVTLDKVRLVAEYEDGSKVVGEHLIDEPEDDKKIVKFYFDNKAQAYQGAVDTIMSSDYIIIGPGDLYTTTLANIIVDGIPQALQKTKAKLIFISNLMSKKGQTRGLTLESMLSLVEGYIGRKFDYVLVNNGRIPEKAYQRYIKQGEHIFKDDIKKNGREVIRADLVANSVIKKDKGDTLDRSLVRHDPDKVANELYKIFRKGWKSKLFSFLSMYR